MMQTQRDPFDLEMLVEQDQLLILLVALQHDDIIDVSAKMDVPLVELEAGIEVASLCNWVDLLNRIISLVVAPAFLDPVHEHSVMELDDGRGHQHINQRVYDLFGVIVKVTLEEVANLSDDHLLLIAFGMKIACILLEEHDRIE